MKTLIRIALLSIVAALALIACSPQASHEAGSAQGIENNVADVSSDSNETLVTTSSERKPQFLNSYASW